MNKTRYRNTESRHRGADFEALILESCERYRRAGAADIIKIPEPLRTLRNMGGGKFLAVYTAKGYPDFCGTLAGGRSVCFEAKYTSGDRIEQSRLTKKQADILETVWSMGACAFVLLMYPDMYARIPWEIWRAMPEVFGHKYISRSEAEVYQLPNWAGRPLFLDGLTGPQAEDFSRFQNGVVKNVTE